MSADRQENEGQPENWPPQEKDKNLEGAGIIGVWLFLLSLAIAFGSIMVGFLAIRVERDAWLPVGSDGLPSSLWVSSALILLISCSAEWARQAVKRDNKAQLKIAAYLSLAASIVFTACQIFAWGDMVSEMGADYSKMVGGNKAYPATFYLLTGIHALHVIGGIVYQIIVCRGVNKDLYWSYHCPAVRYSAMYWHFLGITWFCIFALLSWGAKTTAF